MIPCMMMVLGAVLYKGPGSASLAPRLIVGVAFVRLLLVPLLGEPAVPPICHCCKVKHVLSCAPCLQSLVCPLLYLTWRGVKAAFVVIPCSLLLVHCSKSRCRFVLQAFVPVEEIWVCSKLPACTLVLQSPSMRWLGAPYPLGISKCT